MESSAKDFSEIADALRDQGWTLEKTADNHMKAFPPDKTKSMVVFSAKSGDFRAIRNTIAQLRRSGFQWPPRDGFVPPAPLPLMPHPLRPASNRNIEREVVAEVTAQVLAPLEKIAVEVLAGKATNEELDEYVEAHPPAPPPSQGDALEALFRELKDAKQNLVLCDEMVAHCAEVLEKARLDHEDAKSESVRAVERLRQAKAKFDAEFGR